MKYPHHEGGTDIIQLQQTNPAFLAQYTICVYVSGGPPIFFNNGSLLSVKVYLVSKNQNASQEPDTTEDMGNSDLRENFPFQTVI